LLDFAANKTTWTPIQDEAFNQLKTSLIQAPALVIPRLEEGYKFRVTTDASGFAVGFILE
jgi:hypothetical protein